MSEMDYQMALVLQHKLNNINHSESENVDFQLAKKLQKEFENESNNERKNKTTTLSIETSKCLVDSSWEYIDPTPDVHALFVAFSDRFFWNKLQSVTVAWSKRMTKCAGICSYQGRGGLCSITLSEPLLKLRPRKDLVETLLHEMIHAYLFVTHNNKDRDGHGPEFHKHMYRINKESGTNITVYHDFHDEVRLYQQHWWKCDGPCQKWKPYFGMVRRSMNRAPGPHDRWWGEHSRSCGGTFIKVKEPKKPEVVKKTKQKPEKPQNKTEDIRKFISTSKGSTTTQKNPINSIKTPTYGTNGSTSITDTNNKLPKLSNTDKITKVIPNNNIYGFTNLGNAGSSKNVIPGDNKINGFVMNNGNIATSKAPSSNGKTEITNRFDPIAKKLGGSSSTAGYETVRNHWANKYNEPEPKKPKLSLTNDVNMICCPICNKQIEGDQINSHIDLCLELSEKEKNCIICNVKISVSKYESHVQSCINDAFNDDDDVFIIETKTPKTEMSQETVNCLACGKKIYKTELNSHLEDCMSITQVFENSQIIEDDEVHVQNEKSTKDTSYNCPCCMKLILQDQMNQHIDECLNIVMLEGECNSERQTLLNNLNEDF